MRRASLVLLAAVLVPGVLFSCYEYDSPLDPESETYQGYPTVGHDEPPLLESPAEGEIGRTPHFLWSRNNGAIGYRLEIAFDAPEPSFDLANLVLERELPENEWIPSETDMTALVDGTYAWRVLARSSDGMPGPYSRVRRFTIGDPPTGFEDPDISVDLLDRLLVIDRDKTVEFGNEFEKRFVISIETDDVYRLSWSDSGEGFGGETVDVQATLVEMDSSIVRNDTDGLPIDSRESGHFFPVQVYLERGEYVLRLSTSSGAVETGFCFVRIMM